MMMEELSGQLIVSAPAMNDENFSRTVVLLVQHLPGEGSMGLVINRSLDITIQEIWEQLMPESVVNPSNAFWGGPVEGPLFLIHQDANHADSTILPGVHVSTQKANIQSVIENTKPASRLVIGHAGWGDGQLESEIDAGGWFVLPASQSRVFQDPEEMWGNCCTEIGDAVIGLADQDQSPPHPEAN